MTSKESLNISSSSIDYYLAPEAFSELENSLVEEVVEKSNAETPTIHAVWIPQHNEYANLVRTLEAEKFPEMPDVMADYEDQSTFLALVDTRNEARRIVHAFRLTSKMLAANEIEQNESEVGIGLVDDIIQSDQNLTVEDVRDYYASKNIDLEQCVAVESNFRVGEKVKSETGLRVSDLGYIALFQIFERTGIVSSEESRAAVFAHLNRPAVVSLGAIGLEYEPIAGREDLKTPTVEEDGTKSYDDHYRPVAIPTTENNVEVFKGMTLFAAPTVELE